MISSFITRAATLIRLGKLHRDLEFLLRCSIEVNCDIWNKILDFVVPTSVRFLVVISANRRSKNSLYIF